MNNLIDTEQIGGAGKSEEVRVQFTSLLYLAKSSMGREEKTLGRQAQKKDEV